MKRWRALFEDVFGWATVRNTGVWLYQRHVSTGARRIVPGTWTGYGYQPKDEGWVETGEWDSPWARPSGGSSVVGPVARSAITATLTIYEAGRSVLRSSAPIPKGRVVFDLSCALEPDDIDWLRAVLNQVASNARDEKGESASAAADRAGLFARVGRLKVAFGFAPPVWED